MEPPPRFASFRVVARVRPLTPATAAAGSCLQRLSATLVEGAAVEKNKLVRGAAKGAAPRVATFLSTRAFPFDAAFFPPASTPDVYCAEVAPLVARALAGASACVLAYGATGSGKTHTMTGAPGGGAGAAGLLHMLALELCERVAALNAAGGAPLSLAVSGAEVYMAEIFDLGAPGRAKRHSTATLLRAPVPGADAGALVAAVEALLARRAVGATDKNEHSSRSHALYCVHVARGGAPLAALALVDLAGAEYAAATEGREDARRLEGGKNNLGLMTLKAAFRHIGAAAAGGGGGGGGAPAAAPFSWNRSKLTAALRPFFVDPAGALLLLVTASPDAADAAQTLQALEEGVAVAGRALPDKVVVELGAPPAPAPGFLRAGSGGGGGKENRSAR